MLFDRLKKRITFLHIDVFVGYQGANVPPMEKQRCFCALGVANQEVHYTKFNIAITSRDYFHIITKMRFDSHVEQAGFHPSSILSTVKLD